MVLRKRGEERTGWGTLAGLYTGAKWNTQRGSGVVPGVSKGRRWVPTVYRVHDAI